MLEANGDDRSKQVQFLTDKINFCKHASSSWASFFQGLCLPYKRPERPQSFSFFDKTAMSSSETTNTLAEEEAVILLRKIERECSI